MRSLLTALLLGLALSTACDLPIVDDMAVTPLMCSGPDGSTGCPCRYGASPCQSPSDRCSAANVCVSF